MKARIINEKSIWEDFLLECEEKTFLNSWNWGEFNKILGNKIWRLGVYNNKELICLALISKIIAKRDIFLLIQHGPSIKAEDRRQKTEVLNTLLEKVKEIGKKEKASFIRINPLWERNQKNQTLLECLGFRDAPIHANAYESTWKLDISFSEDELFKNMRKTTRYLIRQAINNQDIAIEKSEKIDNAAIYQKLVKEVAKTQKFTPFSYEYVKNEFNVFASDNQAMWFFGRYKGEIICSALIIFWQNTGFYHQAALLPKYHKIPIAYLLQWEAIKEAKKRGCDYYDFWGYINPKENPNHPWAGPTLFKMGFGGDKKEYVKTKDFPLSKKYWLTYVFERFRKIKRGL